MKKTVIVIVGPTAVGKTKLSIDVAKKFNGEIISGDSMQVYQGMDIGTAKIRREEMEDVPHHMIDIKLPDESFSVADFQRTVQAHIKDIHARNKLPILVGGSGLYIQAVLYDYNFPKQTRDPEFTETLEQEVKQNGIMPLYKKLQTIDPEHAQTIHPNNHRRIIRALEVYQLTNKTVSEHQRYQKNESPYNIKFIGLEMERAALYNRINERIDEMIKNGLENEVKGLYDKGLRDCQSMKAIGYKEFIPYFEGKQTKEETIELLKRNSRRYAKRQYTWFKNKLDIKWYTIIPGHEYETFKNILKELAGIQHNK